VPAPIPRGGAEAGLSPGAPEQTESWCAPLLGRTGFSVSGMVEAVPRR